MRRLTVLLFRDEGPGEDEYIGCVGNYGSEWRSAPGIYERFNVVDEATHERLVEALERLSDVVDAGPEYKVSMAKERIAAIEQARALLAKLEAEKGGEL